MKKVIGILSILSVLILLSGNLNSQVELSNAACWSDNTEHLDVAEDVVVIQNSMEYNMWTVGNIIIFIFFIAIGISSMVMAFKISELLKGMFTICIITIPLNSVTQINNDNVLLKEEITLDSNNVIGITVENLSSDNIEHNYKIVDENLDNATEYSLQNYFLLLFPYFILWTVAFFAGRIVGRYS